MFAVPERGRAVPAGRGAALAARRRRGRDLRPRASRRSWAGPSGTSTASARASRSRCWSGCAPGTASASSPRGCSWTWQGMARASTRDRAPQAEAHTAPNATRTSLLRAWRGPSLQRRGPRFGRSSASASRGTTSACWARRTPPTSACGAPPTAIRGRGANIFTQWVGDPDALGSAVVLEGDPAGAGREGGPHPHRHARPSPEPQPGRALRHRRCTTPTPERLPHGLNCMVDTSPPLGMSQHGAASSR